MIAFCVAFDGITISILQRSILVRKIDPGAQLDSSNSR